jgi:hypothetical protein
MDFTYPGLSAPLLWQTRLRLVDCKYHHGESILGMARLLCADGTKRTIENELCSQESGHQTRMILRDDDDYVSDGKHVSCGGLRWIETLSKGRTTKGKERGRSRREQG